MKLCFIFYSLLPTLIHDALSESMPFNILSPVFGFVPGPKFPLNCTICILYCLKTKSLWRAQRDWPEKFSAIFFNLLPYSSSSQTSNLASISPEHFNHLYLLMFQKKPNTFHKEMGYEQTLEENDYRCFHCREGVPDKMFYARSARSFDMKT